MKPTVSELPNGLHFEWPDANVSIKVSRAKEHRDGRVTAELKVTTSAPGYSPHLHQAQLNLVSTGARKNMVKALSEVYEADWLSILEQCSVMAIEWLRKGEPLVELWGQEDSEPPKYLVDPLLIEGYPNVLFGDPGSFKSAIAVIMAGITTLPWRDNPLRLPPPTRPCKVLYLDWETDSQTVNWTLSRFCRGSGLPGYPLSYRFCTRPLADDLEAIQGVASESEANICIIDSLTMAAGGDLKEAVSATSFYSALRQLHMTSLILAHNAKDNGTIQKVKSIFGSQVFTAQARNIWEVKKLQEPGENELQLGLFHRKAPPFSRISQPLGMRVTFADREIAVKAEDPRGIREFVAELGIKAQIQDLLKDGAMAAPDIATEIGANPDTVRARLNELAKQGKTIRLQNGKWGLAAND